MTQVVNVLKYLTSLLCSLLVLCIIKQRLGRSDVITRSTLRMADRLQTIIPLDTCLGGSRI